MRFKLFPAWFGSKSTTFKIVLAAMFTAIATIANAYATIPVGPTLKFSVVLTVYFFAGIILGAPLGFVVGYIGDLLGWIIFTDGAYNPIIGISTGLFCFIPGLVFAVSNMFIKKQGIESFVINSLISYLLCYVLCTVLLTTWGIWLYTSYIQNKYGTFIAWMAYRALWQLPNAAANYAVSLLVYFALRRVKYFSGAFYDTSLKGEIY